MANGIDFIINGKNNASAAMAAAENGLIRLESGTNRLRLATQGLMTAMGPLLLLYAGLKTAMAAIGGIGEANRAFDDQAESIKGLEVALKMHGDAVGENSVKLQKFADDLQAMTGETDATILKMMKHASILGVATSELEDMTKAGLGLAEVMGTDAASGMERMRQATEGNFAAFNRILPQLRNMESDEEKLAAVLALAAKGFEAKATWANKAAETSAGAGVAIDHLSESLGAILAPFRVLINTGIKAFADSLNQLLVPAVAYAEQMLANIGPIMDWVKDKVVQGVNLMVGAFTFFEVILTNLDQVWILVVAAAELHLTRIASIVMHVLTVQIPAYASWFGTNFVNVMRDAMMNVYTGIENAIQKIVQAFRAFMRFLETGNEGHLMKRLGHIAGRGWLEGFEASLTELPEVAGRVISDREKELQTTVGQIGANLGDEFNRKMEERMLAAGVGAAAELDKNIDLKLKKPGDEVAKALGGGKGASDLQAQESRLLTRGPTDDVKELWQRAVASLQQIMASSGTTATATGELNKKTPQFAPEDTLKVVMVP